MDINAANLEALRKSYNTAFQQGLGFVPPVPVDFLYRDFPSSTASNFYAWMDQIPGFREWVGDRLFKNVRGNKFELVNRDWEDSVSMARKEIEDDQYGVYAPMVQMMGELWTLKKYQLVIAVLTSNAACFTGKAFFAENHAYGDNTITNVVTSALSEATFNAAFLAAAGWTRRSTSWMPSSRCLATARSPTPTISGPSASSWRISRATTMTTGSWWMPASRSSPWRARSGARRVR